MRSGIYFIVNMVNFKIYIGSAVYFARRKSEHFTRLAKGIHHNEHLQRAYAKYGASSFDFIIVEIVKDLDLLLDKETAYIAKHNSTNEQFGYNQCSVGRSAKGRKQSPETIAKRVAKTKGLKRSPETLAKMSAVQIGRTHTEETRRKIGLGHVGIKHPPRSAECKARMKIINTELANRRWAKYREDKLNQPVVIYKG